MKFIVTANRSEAFDDLAPQFEYIRKSAPFNLPSVDLPNYEADDDQLT